MKDKYYIPEKGDIAYGLEFELLVTVARSGNDQNNEWKKGSLDRYSDIFNLLLSDSIIRKIHLFDSIEAHIKNKTIRVKHLDKEDIESLGWKCYDYGEIAGYVWDIEDPPGHWRLCVEEEEGGLKWHGDKSLCQFSIIWFYEGENIAELEFTIKNKSELKTLMKQLNINK